MPFPDGLVKMEKCPNDDGDNILVTQFVSPDKVEEAKAKGWKVASNEELRSETGGSDVPGNVSGESSGEQQSGDAQHRERPNKRR